MLVCLLSFLAIAFGIDQLRALKPIGAVGLSIAIPISQLVFLRSVWSCNRPAFVLGCISVATLAFTMLLAWRNERWMPDLLAVAGIRGMVSVHGVLNTLLVALCFLLAVSLEARRTRVAGVRSPHE